MNGKHEISQDLEKSRRQLASPFGDRCSQSPHVGQPLVASGPLHGSGLAESSQPVSPRKAIENRSTETAHNLEASCASDEILSGSAGERSSRAGNMDVLGSTPLPTDQSLRQEMRGYSHLRPSTLTQLLNSTPLGVVTSERQVYRHRKSAGLLVDSKVNFYRYLAWLVTRRDTPPSRKRTNLDKGDCDLNVKEVLELIESVSYRCALTGKKLTPGTAALDHCIPVSRGGQHEIANAQLLHRDVNRAKGTLTNDEFIKLCRDVVKHTNRIARHSDKKSEETVSDRST